MTTKTETLIHRVLFERISYVTNADDDFERENLRQYHYSYMNGFNDALYHSGAINQDEYIKLSNITWDMLGDRNSD